MANEADAVYKMGAQIAGADQLAGLKEGMKLAEAQNSLQTQRQNLEMQKAAIEDQKFNSVVNMLGTLSRATPAVAKRIAPTIAQRASAAGVPLDQSFLDMYTNDEQNRKDLALAIEAVKNNPNLTMEEKKAGMMKLSDVLEGPAFIQTMAQTYRTEVQDKALAAKEARAQSNFERTVGAAEKKEEMQNRKGLMKAAADAQKIFYETLKSKDSVEALASLQTGEGAVNLANPIGDSQLSTLAAKLFQPGARLSDKDVANLTGDKTLGNRFNQLRNTYLGSGSTISAKDRKDYLEFFEQFRRSTVERIDQAARIASEQAAAANLMDDSESLYKSIMTKSLAAATKTQKAKPKGDPTKLINAARAGNVEAQNYLKNIGIGWEEAAAEGM